MARTKGSTNKVVRKDHYLGPCINCGQFSTYRYVRKMCHACYSRWKTTGNMIPADQTRYPGPCIDCGATDPGGYKYFVRQRCKSCYRKLVYREQNPEQGDRFCADCGTWLPPLKKRSDAIPRCKKCRNKVRYSKTEDAAKARAKRWSKTPKGRLAGQVHRNRRRALKRSVVATLTAQEWQDILTFHNHACVYCGATGNLEMDHFHPLSKGGDFTKNNIVPACRSCNASKRDRPAWEFMSD
jgi:5-methylcytosine-specific restriction endonuclease McrA